ncbi:MAG TPA: hypothetical protein VFO89_03225 [Thermoanaerobaculia bacterium]|nr:hypothetical protein [Thermoanaerobaculia bacterium]
MNTHHRVHLHRGHALAGALLLALTVVIVAPALRDMLRTQAFVRTQPAAPPAPRTAVPHALVTQHFPQEDRALTEMAAHSARTLGHCNILPETLNHTESWSRDWTLHWVDAEHAGATIRLYHATHRHDFRNRYVASWPDGGKVTPWEPAH